MTRKWLTLIALAALVLVLASLLWAATQTDKAQGEMRQKAAQMGERATTMATRAPSVAKEFDRCTKTCETVMPHFRKKYAAQKTHEGDRDCWRTCWGRFGDRSMKSPSATQMKALWMTRRPQHMRANQCAQACWRRFHEGKATVSVAGFRSEPRPWAPGGKGMMSR